MTREKKTIIITGASSGLGAALAIKYSQKGHRLFLLARSKDRLEAVAKICVANGAEANILVVVDVADSTQMEKQLNEIAYKYGIDIVIACAGVSAGTLDGPETPSQVRKIFATNINGVINTVLPVIPHMIERRSGNIVIVSSMAGFLGLSSAPSYSASKGAVRLFSEALRGYLRIWGIYVTTVIPGYVKTPMTSVNNFPMPFMTNAEEAAEKIIKSVAKNKEVIAFPFGMQFCLKLLTMLPSRLITFINSKLPGKPAFEKNNEF